MKKQLKCTFTKGLDIDFILNGHQGYLIGSNSNKSANIKINDSALDNMNLYIVFKYGSYFIVGDHTEANLEESFKS